MGFSPDGTRIVTGGHDKLAMIWDVEKGVLVGEPLKGHTDNITSVSFTPDG